jgi:hypothetical protein
MLINGKKWHQIRIVIPVVAGSSPVGHPSKIKHLAQFMRLGFLLSGVRVDEVGSGWVGFFGGQAGLRYWHWYKDSVG